MKQPPPVYTGKLPSDTLYLWDEQGMKKWTPDNVTFGTNDAGTVVSATLVGGSNAGNVTGLCASEIEAAVEATDADAVRRSVARRCWSR